MYDVAFLLWPTICDILRVGGSFFRVAFAQAEGSSAMQGLQEPCTAAGENH